MIALWYGILAFMLTTYIVLDGRNFGAGILHWIVAKTQAERRQVIAAIGPLWSWHTLSMALFCVLLLTAHGATYLTMKTEGAVHDRAVVIARRVWIAAIPAFLLITLLTWKVRPELLWGLIFRPLAWISLCICGASVLALRTGLRAGKERRAFFGSTFLLFGILMTGAASLYPVLLFSTLDPADQLTAPLCAAPDQSLWIATAWWFCALALAFIYLFIIQRHYSGKVNVSKDNQGLY